MDQFCYQCENANEGVGCVKNGVCGKTKNMAQLQNLLLTWTKHIAQLSREFRQRNLSSDVIDAFFLKVLNATSPGVSFDQNRIATLIDQADLTSQLAEYLAREPEPEYQSDLEKQIVDHIPSISAKGLASLVRESQNYTLEKRCQTIAPTFLGFQELLLSGICGIALHLLESQADGRYFFEKEHLELKMLRDQVKALKIRNTKTREQKKQLQEELTTRENRLQELEDTRRQLLDGIIDQLAFLSEDSTDRSKYSDALREVGQLNFKAMELLETCRLYWYGTPEPSVVRLSNVSGKCILVSGYRFSDLYEVLCQTENLGISIYSHGELMAAHSYPAFKKFPHFAGHYGTGWQNQQKEFDAFPGAILMTSDGMMEPGESYHDYIFTTGEVSWPNIVSIPRDERGRKDFAPLIKAALDSPGFFKSRPIEKVTTGFSSNALTRLWEKFDRALDQGQVTRFYLIGGSDGPSPKREYYRELATSIGPQGVLLTFGSGKFRFFREEFPPLASGLPRFLDMGQTSDVYSALQFFQLLAAKFNDIQKIPVSIFLSWHSSRSLAVLLTLWSLGFKNIFLGPEFPAFFTPEIQQFLQERFGLSLISTPQNDLNEKISS